jgi:hypothetical protein
VKYENKHIYISHSRSAPIIRRSRQSGYDELLGARSGKELLDINRQSYKPAL